MKKTWLVGLLVLCAVIAGVVDWGASRATAVVRRGPLQDQLVLRALVVPARGVAEVSAPGEGRALEVLVREGDRVEAGQTLAKLEVGPKGTPPVLLSAPVAGSVLARRLDSGDSLLVASQGGTRALFEIADASASELRAEIEERDADRLALGLSVTLTTPGARKRIAEGTITRIAPRLERRTIGADDARVRADGQVRATWISWRGASPSIVLGAELEARVALPAQSAALRVPRSAVVVHEGRTVVETPLGWWSRELPVEVAAADDKLVEIRGVREGTRVLLH